MINIILHRSHRYGFIPMLNLHFIKLLISMFYVDARIGSIGCIGKLTLREKKTHHQNVRNIYN